MTKATSRARLVHAVSMALSRFAVSAIAFIAVLPDVADAAQVILTTGTTWTVPSDWNNAANTIEVIGAGAAGRNGDGTYSQPGGGGGGYAKATNVTLSGTATYSVGLGGTPNNPGGDSWFNGPTFATSSVGAKGGAVGVSHTAGGLGGSAALARGGAGGGTTNPGSPYAYSGGNGGAADSSGWAGSGGGGAASPNGAGKNGGASIGTAGGSAGGGGGAGGTSSTNGVNGGNGSVAGGAGGAGPTGTAGGTGGTGGGTGGPGGAGSNGSGGGGAGWGSSRGATAGGGAGGAGTEWDSTHGAGGGGGGAGSVNTTAAINGGAGGLYGAGGGGADSPAQSQGGAGAQGVIVITYTPVVVPPPPPPTASGTRTSSFAYDATSGLLTQEVVEPDLTAFRLQTDYTYDAYGNRITAAVSGVDITSRSAGTSYDSYGQYALTSTNALSQSESFLYDPRFGLPTSHTGPNGLTTTWAYDSFGRKTLETRADGTKTSWSYLFCNGVNGGTATCPTGGQYLVTATPLASDGVTQIGPVTTAYFDLLGRTIAGDSQGFSGAVIRSATQYDALGRVSQKSRPYYVATDTPRWEVYTYDTLGRRTVEAYPDSTSTLHTFHGLTLTDTNTLSQTKTTLKDSQGQVVSVTDAQSHSTSYKYAPFGLLAKVTDAASNITTYTYDQRGRKTASSDPDLGAWSYAYNVLDQLTSKTDAKSQTTTVTYDLLGRMTQRSEPDLVSSWTYDVGTMAIGKLSSVATNGGYLRSHSYDSLGRPSQTQYTVGVSNYSFTSSYDSASRLSGVTYPSGTAVTYSYNGYGYQTALTNNTTSEVYWTANTRDAEQHLLQQTAGNGVVTTQAFNANNGRLNSISAGTSGAVANFSYTYDGIGQLTARTDANTSLSETFTYDSLNRLTGSVVNLSLSKTFGYDAIGNLISKSDVGTYAYPAGGTPLPHAVSSISGTVNTTFAYDANGNQTTGAGLTYVYSSYNKPHSISRGANTILFTDDADHQRFQLFSTAGTTTYMAASGTMAERLDGSGGSTQWTNYLVAGGELVGMRVENGGTVYTRYFNKDHLGSIAVISNETGAVVERLSYDAWGKRRYPDGTDDTTGSVTSQTTRGFTGHEELADVALVHMNGRVYDPLLGRFGTADPTTENPLSTQGWNRYSYVGNSPLNFSDPSGYCFLGCFWQPIFNAIGNLFRSIPILGNILQIALVAMCAGVVVCAGIVAVLSSAFVAGVTSGSLGAALKAGLIAAVTAVAFNVVGDLTLGPAHASPAFDSPSFNAGNYAANIAGHAAVGCLSTMASGGKCGAGALAGATGAAAAPLVGTMFPNAKNDSGQFLGGAAVSSLVGGIASVAGGGKFVNGAETAAFGYLFNAMAGCMRDYSCKTFNMDGGSGGGGRGGSIDLGAAVSAIGGGFVKLVDWLQGDNVYNNTRSGDLPATGQEPNSTQVKDDGNGNGQIRDYGADGKAVTDYDFGHDHTGVGDPHAHDWDWSKVPPRQPPRLIGPNE